MAAFCYRHTLISFVNVKQIGISSGTIHPWVCLIGLAVCKGPTGKTH